MNDDIVCDVVASLQKRFNALPSQCSRRQPMFDAQGREYLVVYTTIPTSLDGREGAIASNTPDFRENKEYLSAFQARDLSDLGEMQKIRKIAKKLDPTRMLVASGDPTIGAPVVWKSEDDKYYVLGGNGRTIAFLIAPQERYEEYVNEARGRWTNIYNPQTKRGYRNLLVRDVYHSDGSSLTMDEAIKLAGASQESTAGKETPLRQGLSRARGMGVTEESNIPAIEYPLPLNKSTILRFIQLNGAFWNYVKSLSPDYIRQQLENLNEQSLPLALEQIEAVLIGRYLPSRFVQKGFGSDKEERAIIGVLPSLASLQQLIDNEQAKPEYNLLDKLEAARDFMKQYRNKSYGDALADYEQRCKQQMLLMGVEPSPVCELNRLGVAFGLYLKRMVGITDPTKGVKDINKYIDEAAKDKPDQLGMFGASFGGNTEDKAADLLIKYALPKSVGAKLMANPSDDISQSYILIAKNLTSRFRSLASKREDRTKTNTISLSKNFPKCRYMKAVVRPNRYAYTRSEANKIKCPIGTFLIEQQTPLRAENSIYRYFHDVLKVEQNVRAAFFTTLHEGKKNKTFPLSAPYYDLLMRTYYKSLGYDICRTGIKSSVSGGGNFLAYLDENALLTEKGGFGDKYIRPIVYLPFPTKDDLISFTENMVDKWIRKAQESEDKKTYTEVNTFENNDFSFPVSSLLDFVIGDDGEISYSYIFEVLGRFRAIVVNYKGKVEVFSYVDTVKDENSRFYVPKLYPLYPNEITTDPKAIKLVDDAIANCKKVSQEYLKEKEALEEKKKKSAKRKTKPKPTITLYKEDGTVKSKVPVPKAQIGEKFGIIKRGKAGTYNYPYILVYIPTGQYVTEKSGMGGSITIRFKKLGKGKAVMKALNEHFVAPKEYPKGYEIDEYKNKEDKPFLDEMRKVIAEHTEYTLQNSQWE